jgi:cyclopropane fatty-acyl-phospholipid synthase-like methyltransferase
MKSLALFSDYIQVEFDGINMDSIQEAEFEPICHKLNLTKDEKLLDIGCALTVYAAREQGAKVLGLTLNRPLHMKLNQAIAAADLQGSVVKFMDYRNLVGVKFDKAVCLEPFATVGRKEMMTLLGIVYNLLHPGGLFLVQCITMAPSISTSPPKLQDRLVRYFDFVLNYSSRNEFMQFNTVERIASQMGFEIPFVENRSAEYLRHLQQWLTCLRANRENIAIFSSETRFRSWNSDLSILLDHIESGDIQVNQWLLSKPSNSHNRVLVPDSQRCCGSRNPD